MLPMRAHGGATLERPRVIGSDEERSRAHTVCCTKRCKSVSVRDTRLHVERNNQHENVGRKTIHQRTSV
eukprot:3850450-Prymnesium_polylepis.2